jgi:hypothetical protein
LYADPVGHAMMNSPVALVQGHAAVRDADLQANTDRYTEVSGDKVPDATKGQPKFLLKRMVFYYARIWVEITPLRILWWPDRTLAGAPDEWRAPEATALPASDPAPSGVAPPPWKAPPADWREVASHSLAHLPLADLTTVDDDGYPLCFPVTSSPLAGDGVGIEAGEGAPDLRPGRACLTLHGHPERFTGQENHTLIGRVEVSDGKPTFRVERALADWSLGSSRATAAGSFLSARKVLAPRLKAEAARRNQKVPKVNFGS